jgi:hypothetical protein
MYLLRRYFQSNLPGWFLCKWRYTGWIETEQYTHVYITEAEPILTKLSWFRMRWMSRGPVLGRGKRFFSAQRCLDRFWGPSILLFIAYWVKRCGRQVDCSHASSTNFKNEWHHTSALFMCLRGLGQLFLFFFFYLLFYFANSSADRTARM